MKIKNLAISISYGWLVIVLTASALFTLVTPRAQAADVGDIYWSPDDVVASITSGVGEVFTVQVRANVTSADAANIAFTYDTTKLSLVSTSLENAVFPNPFGLTHNTNTGSFEVSVYENPGSPNVTGDILLYTLDFRTLAFGDANIELGGASAVVLDGVGVATPKTTGDPLPDGVLKVIILNFTPPPQEQTISDNEPTWPVYIENNQTRTITGSRGDITLNCGTLKGTGTVGDILLTCGTLAPGLSPGILNSGSFTANGGTFEAELGGTTPGQYDQLNVTGTVTLGGATALSIVHWNSFRPTVNNQFIIINNDGSDAISGTFQGLPQGATITVDGVTYTISYTGGDGNDVVLTATNVSSSGSVDTTGNAPGVPNTGFQTIKNYSIISLVSAVLAAVALFYSKRVATRKK